MPDDLLTQFDNQLSEEEATTIMPLPSWYYL